MTFDELIAQGISDTLGEKCAEYCPTGKKHRFSGAYKMGRAGIILFHKKTLSVRNIRYILTVLVSVLFALLGCGIFKGLFKED